MKSAPDNAMIKTASEGLVVIQSNSIVRACTLMHRKKDFGLHGLDSALIRYQILCQINVRNMLPGYECLIGIATDKVVGKML